MSNEIQVSYATGSTIYAVILNLTGQVWNGSAFETLTGGHWLSYAVPLTQIGSTPFYEANFPACPPGTYGVTGYFQVGSTPATTDPRVANGNIDWSGVSAISPVVPTFGPMPAVIPPGSNVMEAIQAYFQTQSALQALTSDGSLWEIEAPEGTQLPFAEFFRVSEPVEDYTTNCRITRATVQFSFHADNLDTARFMSRAFESVLTNAPIYITGADVLHVLPGEYSSTKGEGKGPYGQDSYMEMLEFEVLIDKVTANPIL